MGVESVWLDGGPTNHQCRRCVLFIFTVTEVARRGHINPRQRMECTEHLSNFTFLSVWFFALFTNLIILFDQNAIEILLSSRVFQYAYRSYETWLFSARSSKQASGNDFLFLRQLGVAGIGIHFCCLHPTPLETRQIESVGSGDLARPKVRR